jgi:AraC family carnitine catabolism transcriptional activator
LDTGAFALAAAGALSGYRLTLHWEAIPVFRDAYPDLDVVEQLFVIDRTRFTAAGGIASLDLMLALIAKTHGARLAQSVAETFVHGPPRPADLPQLPGDGILPADQPLLQKCERLIKHNLRFPLSIEELCSGLGVSRRRLERLYNRAGATPVARYRSLRLEAARDQLFYATNPIAHVAEACGFVSAAHFSRAFRAEYGLSPSEFRRRVTREERTKLHPPPPSLVPVGSQPMR